MSQITQHLDETMSLRPTDVSGRNDVGRMPVQLSENKTAAAGPSAHAERNPAAAANSLLLLLSRAMIVMPGSCCRQELWRQGH